MGKEARALLKKINDKKSTIKSLLSEGKTKEAKEAKAELIEMQEQFDILMDLDDDDRESVKDNLENGEPVKIAGENKKPTEKDVARAFVNRIVCGMRKTQMNEEDKKIMDAMSETSNEDGGFTVPQDIQTTIHELRRSDDDLEQYVNVEPVTTLSGSRVYEIDADATPWEDVDEGEAFEETGTPKFRQIKYKIGKKGGILKVTRELLMDSAENILGFLNKWIAKKSRATRNTAILKKLEEITTGKEVVISGYDDMKDVFNVTLDPAIAASAVVLTNQSGFNYLDKIKDTEGHYILQHDVTDKSKMLLFGVYPVKKVSDKVLKNTTVKKGGQGSDKDDVVAIKYPIYMGDLKEAITLFDREKISIELSTEAGDLWAKDQTGIKVRDRFDVQAFDAEAVIRGEITVNIAG